jgi:hypothetical protein
VRKFPESQQGDLTWGETSVREISKASRPWEGTYYCTNKIDEVVLEGFALQESEIGSTDIATPLTTLLLEKFKVRNTWKTPQTLYTGTLMPRNPLVRGNSGSFSILRLYAFETAQ